MPLVGATIASALALPMPRFAPMLAATRSSFATRALRRMLLDDNELAEPIGTTSSASHHHLHSAGLALRLAAHRGAPSA